MAFRPLFRRFVFLFILIALWPLTFFKHGYDGHHEASLVNSSAFLVMISLRINQVALLLVRGTTIAYCPHCTWERLLLFENHLPLSFRLRLPFDSFIYQWRCMSKPWS